MSSLRKIDAPGIEVNEIDHSQYDNKPDYSLPNAPTCMLYGFSDQGENESTHWINTKQTLIDTYGYPKNEPERYFYNGCLEVLARGGLLVASKLPYDNYSKDRYAYVKYGICDLSSTVDSAVFKDTVLSADRSLTSYIEISSQMISSGTIGDISNIERSTMAIDTLDSLLTNGSKDINDGIYIVDITKQQYSKTQFNCVKTDGNNTDDCLGIVPVIVTPTNAMFFQNLLPQDETKSIISSFNPVSMITPLCPEQYKSGESHTIAVTLSALNDNQNMYVPLSAESKGDISLSRTATNQFPNIAWKAQNKFDPYYLKQIGVVVFRAYSDKSNNDKINFDVVESFVGSLDRDAKNEMNSSVFIDDVINSNSKFIRFFSKVSKDKIQRASFVTISNQIAASLGFYQAYCEKKITRSESILKPLQRLFDKHNNPMSFNVDLVIDAGLTNIYTYLSEGIDKQYDSEKMNSSDAQLWTTLAQKFDTYCKSIRKDCMFIADAPRKLCLAGDQKIIRKTAPSNNIDKDIIPNLRLLTGINSSYSTGYCDWFLTNDDYSGDLFWCPPSIKAASTYCYTDTYFHTWNAPAGLTRGVVRNVRDVAFNPSNQEAGKIYTQCWNYAVSYPIDGIVFEGQKTFQKAPTALDRINVRRLLLWLEKRVFQKSKYFLYENNSQYLRSKFVDTIKPYFEQAKNGDGLLDYVIKCDSDNNTPTTIDRNELHCTIAVKPVKALEYLILNFICTSQTASVTEEAANF